MLLTDSLNQAPLPQTFRIRLKAPEFLIWLIFYQWAYFCDHLNASEQFFGNLFSGHGGPAYIFTGAKCVWRLPNEIVPIIDQWTAAVMDKNCTLIGSELWAMFDKKQATALVSFRKLTVRRDHYLGLSLTVHYPGCPRPPILSPVFEPSELQTLVQIYTFWPVDTTWKQSSHIQAGTTSASRSWRV